MSRETNRYGVVTIVFVATTIRDIDHPVGTFKAIVLLKLFATEIANALDRRGPPNGRVGSALGADKVFADATLSTSRQEITSDCVLSDDQYAIRTAMLSSASFKIAF